MTIIWEGHFDWDWLDMLVGGWIGAIIGIAAISIVSMARE